jgi:Zn-dependent protease
MKGIRLFEIFGIPVYVHATFLMLPVLFYFTAGPKGVFVILFVFACVTAHELCHSFTARRFGVRTGGITLYPIGGVASIISFPEKPYQELLISLAGPAFNIISSAALFYPLYRLLGPDVLFRPSLRSWPHTFAYAFWVNPSLAVFNLLPAFPMDGGRILRAFLAGRMGIRRATRIAVGVGHFFALLFGFIGIRDRHYMLVIIAIFIYIAASNEAFQVEFRESLKEHFGLIKETGGEKDDEG